MKNNTDIKTGLKKILALSLSDLKRVTSSIVATIMLFGLCVVPCLYGWFNIFSNWDPYGSDATGRIKIAVVSVDEGASIMGLELNVGDKVVEGLEANKTIGWVFVDSLEQAYNLALSGDCYAAIVIPQEFSKDVLSFIDLGFEHPTIYYYENQKKNAIAPKITGKAKTAVQEQVNKTFIETMASGVQSVLKLMDAAGVDYDSTLESLSDKVDNLQDTLDQVDGLLGSLCNLCSATANLMYYSSILSGNIAETAYNSQTMSNVLSQDAASLNVKVAEMNTEIKNSLISADQYLGEEYEKYKNGEITEEQLKEDLQNKKGSLREEQAAVFQQIIDKINAGGSLDQSDYNMIAYAVLEARSVIIYDLYRSTNDISPAMSNMLGSLSSTSANAANAFGGAGNTVSDISSTLGATVGTLQQMEGDLYKTRQDIIKAKERLMDISDTLDELAGSEFLRELTNSAIDNNGNITSYFASPIRMNTVVQYPIPTYGSAMAPFYTVLAQWVGALFCACIIKVKVRKEDAPGELTVTEHYFGRFAIFLACCLIQALVVSIGDLTFIDIYCVHPGRFVFAAVMTGICFATINYSLLFALDKIGLGASVIIMVIQVAGSGGSYPIEVVPKIFQIIYPIMPFKFAMNGMREAIAGTYSTNYLFDMLALVLVTAIFTALGLLLKKPASKLIDIINESSEKAEIML